MKKNYLKILLCFALCMFMALTLLPAQEAQAAKTGHKDGDTCPDCGCPEALELQEVRYGDVHLFLCKNSSCNYSSRYKEAHWNTNEICGGTFICEGCGMEYTEEHEWDSSTGKCKKCQADCTHPIKSRLYYESKDDTTCRFYCNICYNKIKESHTWIEGTGKCKYCGYKCKHTDQTVGQPCARCGLTVPEPCDHDWGTGYISDDTAHWHECSKCGEKKDKQDHNFNTSNHDESSHWTECSTCGAKDAIETHTWENGTCPECGYTCAHTGQTGITCTNCGLLLCKHPTMNWIDDGSGHHVKKCADCGYIDESSKEDHKWSEDYVADGTKGHYRVCTLCEAKSSTESHQRDTFRPDGDKGHYEACPKCGEKLSDELEPHSFSDPAYTWDSEYKTCKAEQTCSSCKYTKVTNGTVTTEVKTPATCAETGVKVVTATFESPLKTQTKEVAIPVDENAHSWDEGKVTKAATCTATGEKTYTCRNDSTHTKKEEIAIDKDAHSWDDGTVTKAPTCAEKGVLTYTCRNDSSHAREEEIAIDKDAHTWDDGTVTKAPTCAEKGVLTYTCKNDPSHTREEEIAIDKDAHSWDEGKVTKAATCTEKGVLTYTCKNDLSHTKTEEIAIDKDAHSWDEGKVTVPATCTEAGLILYTCRNDETHTRTEVIPAGGGHKLTATPAREATCTEDGNSAYWTCSECKKYFSDAEGKTEIQEGSWVIRAAGHKLTATAAKEATCTEDGNSAYWTCSECRKYFSDAEGKTEIQEGSWVIKAHHPADKIVTDDAVLPTCEKTGLTAGSHCEECGAVIVAQEVIEPLGHEFMGWHTDNAGNHTNRCITCRLEKTVACSMTALPGHEGISFCPICGYCEGEGAAMESAIGYLEKYDGVKTGVPRYYTLNVKGEKYLIISFENNGQETRTEGEFTFTLPEEMVKGFSFRQIDADGTETPVEITESYGYHRITLDFTPEGKEPVQVMILKIVGL